MKEKKVKESMSPKMLVGKHPNIDLYFLTCSIKTEKNRKKIEDANNSIHKMKGRQIKSAMINRVRKLNKNLSIL